MLKADTSGLVSALQRFRKELAREFKEATFSAASEARWFIQSGAYWRNRSGKTSRSFRVIQASGLTSGSGHTVTSASPIAGFIQNGTRPHVIEAKAGGVLSFVQNGSRRFAKRVNHPGTKAVNYEQKEAARMAPVLARKADAAAQSAAVSSGLL